MTASNRAPSKESYYKVLGVEKTANNEQITAAYQQKSMVLLAEIANDATKSAEMHRLLEIFNTLIDTRKRAEYDNQYRAPITGEQTLSKAQALEYARKGHFDIQGVDYSPLIAAIGYEYDKPDYLRTSHTLEQFRKGLVMIGEQYANHQDTAFYLMLMLPEDEYGNNWQGLLMTSPTDLRDILNRFPWSHELLFRKLTAQSLLENPESTGILINFNSQADAEEKQQEDRKIQYGEEVLSIIKDSLQLAWTMPTNQQFWQHFPESVRAKAANAAGEQWEARTKVATNNENSIINKWNTALAEATKLIDSYRSPGLRTFMRDKNDSNRAEIYWSLLNNTLLTPFAKRIVLQVLATDYNSDLTRYMGTKSNTRIKELREQMNYRTGYTDWVTHFTRTGGWDQRLGETPNEFLKTYQKAPVPESSKQSLEESITRFGSLINKALATAATSKVIDVNKVCEPLIAELQALELASGVKRMGQNAVKRGLESKK